MRMVPWQSGLVQATFWRNAKTTRGSRTVLGPHGGEAVVAEDLTRVGMDDAQVLVFIDAGLEHVKILDGIHHSPVITQVEAGQDILSGPDIWTGSMVKASLMMLLHLPSAIQKN
jgi:hypothetical protein